MSLSVESALGRARARIRRFFRPLEGQAITREGKYFIGISIPRGSQVSMNVSDIFLPACNAKRTASVS